MCISGVTCYYFHYNFAFFLIFFLANSADTDEMPRFAKCKIRNFRENFIFANSDKHIFAKLKIRDRGVILILISVNDSDQVISPIREDFIFTKLRILCEVSKTKPRENFRIYSTRLAVSSLQRFK